MTPVMHKDYCAITATGRCTCGVETRERMAMIKAGMTDEELRKGWCPPHGPWLQSAEHGVYQCQKCGFWFDDCVPAPAPSVPKGDVEALIDRFAFAVRTLGRVVDDGGEPSDAVVNERAEAEAALRAALTTKESDHG